MGKTILVADDNERIRKAACALLLDSEDLAACLEAENGLEALNLTIERKPDLVILDFSMPVMDGLEAAKRIHEALPDLPIVLFSLHGSVLRSDQWGEVGIVATVSKQNATSQLVSTVHSLLKIAA